MSADFIRIGTNGRVCIPTKIRRKLNLKTEDILEVSVDRETVVLKKYITEETLTNALNEFQSRFEIESSDLKYHDVKEIEKRINEIRMILEKKV